MKLTAAATVINDEKLNTNISNAQTTAAQAKTIADNTNQYFWFTSTGTDTGAHISEKTQAQFISSPSGGNLLARSNGIAVRDGLVELATFGASGARIGKKTTARTEIDSNRITMITDSGATAIDISGSGSSGTLYKRVNVEQTVSSGSSGTVSYAGVSSGTAITLRCAQPNISAYLGNTVTVTVGTSSSGTVTTYPKYSYSFNGSVLTINANQGNDVVMCWYEYEATIEVPKIEMAGKLYLEGHSTEVGSTVSAYLTQSKAITAGNAEPVCHIALTAGTWVITAVVRFPNASDTTYRLMKIAEGPVISADLPNSEVSAINGYPTVLTATKIVKLNAGETADYFLNVKAGKALTLEAGSVGGVNYIEAVRIA